MTRRLRTIVCGAIALLITVLCALSPRAAMRAGPAMVPLGVPSAPGQVERLPKGFAATVDRATSDRFVRVVVDDVDRDGDLDVVASLGSLDLMVWKNDGAGHFTRVISSQHSAFQTQPPAPSVDGQSAGSDEWIQNDDRHAARDASPRPIFDAAPVKAMVQALWVIPPQSGPRPRSSRAPPLA
jgi:hypothetical protein